MSTTTTSEKKKVRLGSGHLYAKLFTGSLPSDSEIETDGNRLGYISGGAELSYTPTFKTVKDDLGYVVEIFLTEEEVKLKSGVLTWNGNTLRALSATGRVTESGNIRTVKIGGLDNYNGEKYVIRFVHSDPKNGTIRITIVGQNQAGFTLAFKKDTETVIDAEFLAMPNLDSVGTLVEYREVIDAGQAANVFNVTRTYTGLTGDSYSAQVGEHAAYLETLTADDGYKLPASVAVTIGGESATSGTDYIYNAENGILCIPCVTGDIAITAAATEAEGE